MLRHVWETTYPLGVSWRDPLPPPVPVESFLESAAEKWPDQVAIDFYDRTLTFREVLDLSRRVAAGLQAAGVRPGVHVGLHLLNVPHFIICFFGILMAGGHVVNFSPLAGTRELKYQLSDSDTEFMVTLAWPTLYPEIAALKGTAKLNTIILCRLEDFLPDDVAFALGSRTIGFVPGPGREIAFADLIRNDGIFTRHPRVRLEDELAALQYTGGSTGQPKGAMLTHANFSAAVHSYAHWIGSPTVDQRDIALVVLPLFHIFGLCCAMLLAMVLNSQLVLHIRFDPKRVLADISRKKVTIFSGVPSMYTALVNDPEAGQCDLSSIRVCRSGGAPLHADVLQQFKRMGGTQPGEGYGLTETTSVGTTQIPRNSRAGTVGLPLPHAFIEIVDPDTGLPLPNGKSGEICISGPFVMKGYWKNPAATADAFRGGHLHTGDIGVLFDDGYLVLVDRLKDMILCGGHNVYPRTIEEAIYEHPSVAEAAVVGISDPGFGQIAKAFIVLKPDRAAFSYTELCMFLKDKLAQYELPLQMEIRAALPKTPAGKVAKIDLVELETNARDRSPGDIPRPRARPVPDQQASEDRERDASLRSETENLLAKIWSQVLGNDGLGREDNFFVLGGNSLLGAQVVARVRDEFALEIPLRTLFERPKLADLADSIDTIRWAARGSSATAINQQFSSEQEVGAL
jgi:long-chain acyl-CoA synthetase